MALSGEVTALRRRWAVLSLAFAAMLMMPSAAWACDKERLSELFTQFKELYAAESYSESESFALERLSVAEESCGTDHAETARSLNDLAALYMQLGHTGKAMPLFERLVEIFEKQLEIYEEKLGPGHPRTATILQNLAVLYQNLGRYDEAKLFYERALAINKDQLSPDHPPTARYPNDPETYRQAASRIAEELGKLEPRLFHHADAEIEELLRTKGVDGETEYLLRTKIVRDRVLEVVYNFALASAAQDEAYPDLTAVGFSVWQRLKTSTVAEELARAAAVLQLDDAVLQEAVRALDEAHKDFVVFSDLLDQQRQAGARTDAITTLVRQRDAALVKRQQAQTVLERTDEDFAIFARPEPTGFNALQSDLLSEGEALIAFAQVGPEAKYLAFVVTKDKARFVALEPTGEEVAGLVAKLREGTALPAGVKFGVSDLADLKFNLEAAHALYSGLIAPLEPHLADMDHLLIVPDGPLESLSFNLLVTSVPQSENEAAQEVSKSGAEEDDAPQNALDQAQAMAMSAWKWLQRTSEDIQASFQSDGDTFAVYRDATWLSDKYAVSTLPTVGSIEAIRKLDAAPGRQPFLGFGNPLLDGPTAQVAQSAGAEALLSLGPGEAANVSQVKALTPIPQTGPLLEELARALESTSVHLYTGQKGTEQDLNLLNERGLLRDYRTIAFATHALVAGELPSLGLDEPALVLTPPANDNDVLFSNDGLLRASEVVGLNLNADWVLLTACNTAASDGTLGAEPLSGLAKSFFKAGSRALLVSHWPAEASAAAELIPDLIKRTAQGEPRAKALSNVMAALRNDPDNPHFAHPALWAPFVIVGEGG